MSTNTNQLDLTTPSIDNSTKDGTTPSNIGGITVTPQALPEKLDWMAASEFILDVAIRFKLGRTPPSELLTDSNSAAQAFGHRV
ncbi:hypothetical protein PCANC_23782 [Puccinia coronata f. sp. avenae]|uniref:Uncharacterized protein n=1 Tax=Puccinia coronata f. sp. avenae TaxID=200324 RepID=A0A2N5SFM0_9BASI|nr:hypothetical protein PCANC_23782 [Puccinia coronata f. sp. avenae]